MDSWIAVRGRGSTGFSTMDRGQGAGEVLRVQHHGQRTCRAFGSVDSGQREACGVQHHGQRSGDGMCTGFSTMDSDSVRGMGSGNGLGEWDGMGWDATRRSEMQWDEPRCEAEMPGCFLPSRGNLSGWEVWARPHRFETCCHSELRQNNPSTGTDGKDAEERIPFVRLELRAVPLPFQAHLYGDFW